MKRKLDMPAFILLTMTFLPAHAQQNTGFKPPQLGAPSTRIGSGTRDIVGALVEVLDSAQAANTGKIAMRCGANEGGELSPKCSDKAHISTQTTPIPKDNTRH